MKNNSIEIVMVLYGCTLGESKTYRSIVPLLDKLKTGYEFIIFNNNTAQTIEHDKYIVVNSKENVKIVGAYNYALKRAVKNQIKWLLLLDEDTVIPNNYFTELTFFFEQGYKDELVAVAPILISHEKVLSPKRIGKRMRFEYNLDAGYTTERINAFNSMSLFDVSFFNSIGGFPEEYPLDMHDHWCYHQIFKYKKSIYILNVIAIHDSSFVDFEKNVSPTRYKTFIEAESKFISNELGLMNTIFYKIKLLLRSLKQFINIKNKKFSLITLSYIFK